MVGKRFENTTVGLVGRRQREKEPDLVNRRKTGEKNRERRGGSSYGQAQGETPTREFRQLAKAQRHETRVTWARGRTRVMKGPKSGHAA